MNYDRPRSGKNQLAARTAATNDEKKSSESNIENVNIQEAVSKKKQVRNSAIPRRPLPQFTDSEPSNEPVTTSELNPPKALSEANLSTAITPTTDANESSYVAAVRKSGAPKQQKRKGVLAEKVESVLITQPIDVVAMGTPVDTTDNSTNSNQEEQKFLEKTENVVYATGEDDNEGEFKLQKRKSKRQSTSKKKKKI